MTSHRESKPKNGRQPYFAPFARLGGSNLPSRTPPGMHTTGRLDLHSKPSIAASTSSEAPLRSFIQHLQTHKNLGWSLTSRICWETGPQPTPCLLPWLTVDLVEQWSLTLPASDSIQALPLTQGKLYLSHLTGHGIDLLHAKRRLRWAMQMGMLDNGNTWDCVVTQICSRADVQIRKYRTKLLQKVPETASLETHVVEPVEERPKDSNHGQICRTSLRYTLRARRTVGSLETSLALVESSKSILTAAVMDHQESRQKARQHADGCNKVDTEMEAGTTMKTAMEASALPHSSTTMAPIGTVTTGGAVLIHVLDPKTIPITVVQPHLLNPQANHASYTIVDSARAEFNSGNRVHPGPGREQSQQRAHDRAQVGENPSREDDRENGKIRPTIIDYPGLRVGVFGFPLHHGGGRRGETVP
ncbi:hypothetical protein CONLIGDRAFT_692459 [Coniochaeta ligniaria NRRL 30616]|uniref:Uncharacterized protein n=1 Tax=Coniochaeta ligniaria NRRL 30616 TaxID=1408157 RepID=A0A1J7IAB7_9PEZI|nr:hypothetical protein CONLIGDRAFT_692459 [Coniochaeta ligniaria NRRL 30616]